MTYVLDKNVVTEVLPVGGRRCSIHLYGQDRTCPGLYESLGEATTAGK